MPRDFRFRIVNVFAESTFGGNPLCVFEDGAGLSDAEMQALARQFNLSETTFILPSDVATARVRVFTPGYEMPFAGHPTLGTAYVVHQTFATSGHLTLEFKAGVVSVDAADGYWSFRAPGSGRCMVRRTVEPAGLIARMIGLDADDLAGVPSWVDTGADQLLIPVKTIASVQRAAPDSSMLDQWPVSSIGRKTGYVFAFEDDSHRAVQARYFFTMQGGGVSEDPGTGSACANLGGWLQHIGHPLPVRIRVSQGDLISRPCRLQLEVRPDGGIYVGGAVRQIASGTVSL